MITHPLFVNIPVSDQDRALQFYVETLGFELVGDTPMGPDEGAPRWIQVAPPEGQTHLVLYTPEGSEDLVGRFSPVWLQTDDLDATYAALRAKGVEFPTEPQQADWDPSMRWAQLRDPDGNVFGLS